MPAGENPSSSLAARAWVGLLTAAGVLLATPGIALAAPALQAHAKPSPRAAVLESRPLHPGPLLPALPLTQAQAPPPPAPPDLAGAAPLKPHEVFGFAPYWSLGYSGRFDVSSFSTIAYFGLDVWPDGTLVKSGSGWEGYQSAQLADLVGRAHAGGTRVVLTAKNFDQPSLDQLSSDPGAAGRLAADLADAIRARNLDGANLDFEGSGAADRAGFAAFASSVAQKLHAVDPHWQVTVDTYTSSASDPSGFFDLGRMAAAVDGFFVMAYDMGDHSRPSPNDPLGGAGWNDAAAVAAYRSAVAASKVILGLPFYGYDWPVDGEGKDAQPTGAASPVTYGQLAGAGRPEYWDPVAQSAWTTYQAPDGWHLAYFDDPQSIALRARLADAAGLAGVGVWALGMEGGSAAMIAALLGQAAPLKGALGPATSSAASRQGPGATPAASPAASPSPSPSPSASASPPVATPARTSAGAPSQVGGLSAQAPNGYNEVAVSWQPANGGSGQLSYEVYGSTDPAFTPGPGNLLATATGTSFLQQRLGLHQAWSYRVRAVDSSGQAGAFSPEASALTGGTLHLEAEWLLPAAAATAPAAAQGDCCGVQWSGGAQLLFSGAKAGDSLSLKVTVPQAGAYELLVDPTRGPAYGTWALSVDGRPAGQTFDAYAAGLNSPDTPSDFGPLALAAGDHTLTLTLAGKDAASSGYLAGLDFLDLKGP